MFTTARCWRNVGYHSGLAITSERILKNLSQFTSSEWRMFFVEVQCSYTLLKS